MPGEIEFGSESTIGTYGKNPVRVAFCVLAVVGRYIRMNFLLVLEVVAGTGDQVWTKEQVRAVGQGRIDEWIVAIVVTGGEVAESSGQFARFNRQAFAFGGGGVGAESLQQAPADSIAVNMIGLIGEEWGGMALPGGVEIPVTAELESGSNQDAGAGGEELAAGATRVF